MGLFGGSSSGSASAASSPQLEAATAELDMITDVFNRLVESCHAKCISPRYAEADLNKGESVCVDRCVSKFFAVNAKVGEQMQALGQAASAAGGRMMG
ncbi:mitochondrial import inner membrane translocase subunit TIM10 [Malassezia restricta]|uniref:Mitochondrial import inner membrane translocase subunit n=1 Tax=Malassezia restricta (strain ATCC 96810 / NBRC 103918 / CBS 7877) TaxID=425264 RepID=A0A3G2S9Z8_MALR7|nr:mitochondrial import inner membrane translocase subunit TIM10 [Malassezia restricta]AXA52351.1 mitochondrial import inner membrane translocase subunit TIM10 [Malassezia restricta]AYO44931.1 Mitochondrial import inner membrane translocase subunit TIM10 [Malassezia restricta CBS 7877]